MTDDSIIKRLIADGSVEPVEPEQFEDVTKAATREEATQEDRWWDYIRGEGWTKVEVDEHGNLLSPVLFRDPLDPTNVVTRSVAYFTARRRLD